MAFIGVESNSFYKKTSGDYNKRHKSGNGAYDNFAKNLGKRAEQTNANTQKEAKNMRAVQADYYASRMTTNIAVMGTGHVKVASIIECSARHITYSESDYVKVCMSEGYTLKAQVELDAHKVYIEQKNEDGTVKGYEVNPLVLDKDTENPIEQMALESWELTRKAMQGDGNFTEFDPEKMQTDEDKEVTFEEALLEFYHFVEERIKNGPPKVRIGGSEFSVEEWERLLEKVDKTLEEIKEEIEEQIRRQKEQELLKEILNGKQEEEGTVTQKQVESLLEDRDETVEETTRGRSFMARIQGEKKAPYSYLADENGCINYKGVIFHCDDEKQQITLGDVSDLKQVIRVPLSKGGCLLVNRDNLGELAKAIGMFSSEDINRIMRAIAQDTKAQQIEMEIEEQESEIGNIASES